MRPKLKIDHISNLHDARYCSAVGIMLLGFNMDSRDPDRIASAVVADVMGWLSGPESIAEFGYETPDEMQAMTEGLSFDLLSLPMDYPVALAEGLEGHLIFRATDRSLSVTDGLTQVAELATKFPEALFEFALDEGDESAWGLLKSKELVSRCLLRLEDPDAIYNSLKKEGLQAYGFSLGEFLEEPGGTLDYEKCDDFVERFNEIVLL